MDLQLQAKIAVVEDFNKHSEITDDYVLTVDEVYVVWFTKTLQNWKAMVSTTVPDAKYYEVTYDGDKKQTYVDTYVKVRNVAYPD